LLPPAARSRLTAGRGVRSVQARAGRCGQAEGFPEARPQGSKRPPGGLGGEAAAKAKAAGGHHFWAAARPSRAGPPPRRVATKKAG